MVSILTELVFIYSVRVRPFILKAVPPSVPIMILTAGAAAVTVMLPFSYVGQRLFQFQLPTITMMAIVIMIVVSYFIVTETVKLLYYRSIGPDRLRNS
jgi:hypothetical protein